MKFFSRFMLTPGRRGVILVVPRTGPRLRAGTGPQPRPASPGIPVPGPGDAGRPCASHAAAAAVPAATGGAQMPEDRFPVEVVQGVPVVAAPEEIDITNAEALRAALLTAAAAADGCGTLVVDMTRTRFCDSSGLHTLIAAHKRAGAEGREVLLVIPSTTVLRVFALTGMDMVIPTFTSLPEALAQAAAAANGRSRQPDEADA